MIKLEDFVLYQAIFTLCIIIIGLPLMIYVLYFKECKVIPVHHNNFEEVTNVPITEEKLLPKPKTNEEIGKVFVEIEVCNNSATKTYMDYKAITNTSSPQYNYIKNHLYDVDGNLNDVDGYLYTQDGYMAVALGSYWGDIGDKFIFHLDTGIELKVVKVDRKADRHTYGGCQQRWDGSVLEILVSSETIPYPKESNGYYFFGNFNNNPAFKGKIERVYKVVE